MNPDVDDGLRVRRTPLHTQEPALSLTMKGRPRRRTALLYSPAQPLSDSPGVALSGANWPTPPATSQVAAVCVGPPAPRGEASRTPGLSGTCGASRVDVAVTPGPAGALTSNFLPLIFNYSVGSGGSHQWRPPPGVSKAGTYQWRLPPGVCKGYEKNREYISVGQVRREG